MLILITYDVNTTTGKGRKRLSKIAKICCNYGQRVQNSVFECDVDSAQYAMMRNELLSIFDEGKDGLRFYNLGSHYARRIEHYGAKETYDPEGIIML